MGNCFSISPPSVSVNSVVCYCYEFIAGQAQYVYKLEENLDGLGKALKGLTVRKNDVVREVTVAEEQQLRRLEEVQSWISSAEAMETKAQELLQRRSLEMDRLCFWGYCSHDYRSSYEFGKEVSKMLAEVTALRNEGVFEEVAAKEPIAPVVEIPVEPTVGLESLFDEVWRDLNDENVRIMGLYGMGGVGKTTLLKNINNNFLRAPNDYYVIWVVVSKDPTLEKIQNDIGEKVGCSDDKWKDRNCDQKAKVIFKVLSRKKFVLLLDDIWKRIDLGEVGVPFTKNQNGSKVVFTTRSMEVCGEMEADKEVEVKCLSWEKSWELFKEKVGEETLSFDPDIPNLAEEVAKECKGLPLALITIGRSMARKSTPREWRYAIRVLNNSASDISGMRDKVLSLLKFSYDNLSSEKVRSCFLYCALFPEDWEIERDDLINYWMCEGLLDEYTDINSLPDQGYTIIGSLLYACLLEESSEGTNHVKMHDVIRDMALWIASGCGKEENRVLVKANALLVEPPMIEKWNEVERISLMKNRIERLSGSPTCPKLSTLFLHYNALCRISDGFFEFMPKLTVLDLSCNRKLTDLPLAISNLVSLQYLNLAYTGIKQLPEELKNLVMLKYLNLECTNPLDIIPKGVISSFSRLQFLNLRYCGYSHNMVEDSVQIGGNELLVQELMCLKHIITLRVSIKCVSALESLLTSQILLNSTQNLYLHNSRTLQFLNVLSFSNMERLERLSIVHCKSLEELKIDWDWDRRDEYSQLTSPLRCSMFLSLRDVEVQLCDKLKDLTGLIFAPNMYCLSIYNCSALEEIINVDTLSDAPEVVKHLEPFLKLETLKLRSLPKLKNIYPKPLPFLCLKLIYVMECEKLKKLPINSNITRMGPKLTIRGEESWWNELEWEDVTTRDAFLPCYHPVRGFLSRLFKGQKIYKI